MRVIKIGGGCLCGVRTVEHIVELVAERCQGSLVVASALYGVTNRLFAAMNAARESESAVGDLVDCLRDEHLGVARQLMDEPGLEAYRAPLEAGLGRLERLLFGVHFTRELTPRMRDAIACYGERLCVELLAHAVRARGVASEAVFPEDVGMASDGKYGDATADLSRCKSNFARYLLPLAAEDKVLFLPGYYGVSAEGEVTTFGRGGSDYSAAVAAASLGAPALEIWKDTQGFMTADPKFVAAAKRVPELTYNECAELAYFGAGILHPRTIEPLRSAKVPIEIRNTMNPEAPGSRIMPGLPDRREVCSVAHTTDVALLKVHASGVGARPGILAQVAESLSTRGINIKSVVTSQTCISLLLAESDLEAGARAVAAIQPRPYRRLERVPGVALVAIVGEGLGAGRGVAARLFTAVAASKANIEMTAFGPSRAALYFLVKTPELQRAVAAAHDEFFG